MKTRTTTHEKILRAIIIISALITITAAACRAQKVERNGNNFRQIRPGKDSTRTEYTYTDSKGKTAPIFLSKSGKAYVPKTSKNGKYYRRYLPEVTKQIANKEN